MAAIALGKKTRGYQRPTHFTDKAAHRGRFFEPFADDDPKMAEIQSKILLLARDQEIQDPSILEPLRT